MPSANGSSTPATTAPIAQPDTCYHLGELTAPLRVHRHRRRRRGVEREHGGEPVFTRRALHHGSLSKTIRTMRDRALPRGHRSGANHGSGRRLTVSLEGSPSVQETGGCSGTETMPTGGSWTPFLAATRSRVRARTRRWAAKTGGLAKRSTRAGPDLRLADPIVIFLLLFKLGEALQNTYVLQVAMGWDVQIARCIYGSGSSAW